MQDDKNGNGLAAAVAVIESSSLTSWAAEDVAAMVDHVLTVYYPNDPLPLMVEEELQYGPVKGIVDLVFPGDVLKLVDWKTSGRLDEGWQVRQRRSNQPRLYAALLGYVLGYDGPVVVEIRGLTVNDGRVSSQVLSFLVKPEEARQVYDHYEQLYAHIRCMDVKQSWLKNPGGCRLYGNSYPCMFEAYCWQGGELDLTAAPTWSASYSSIEDFLRCPERYRLKQLTGKEDSSEAIQIGQVFHLAVSELYKAKLMEEK